MSTTLHGLQDVENHCAHLRDIELKTGRKIPYLHFPHVLFQPRSQGLSSSRPIEREMGREEERPWERGWCYSLL